MFEQLLYMFNGINWFNIGPQLSWIGIATVVALLLNLKQHHIWFLTTLSFFVLILQLFGLVSLLGFASLIYVITGIEWMVHDKKKSVTT